MGDGARVNVDSAPGRPSGTLDDVGQGSTGNPFGAVGGLARAAEPADIPAAGSTGAKASIGGLGAPSAVARAATPALPTGQREPWLEE